MRFQPSDPCCFYRCKDTNFSANHNGCLSSQVVSAVAFIDAKIRIFQLITTLLLDSLFYGMLLLSMQRYEFFS